jgi:GTP-binding protein
MEAQDLAILHLIEKHKKGMVIAVNKWDLIEKEKNTDKKYVELISKRIEPLSGVPVVFISAKEKLRIHKALQTLIDVFQEKEKRIPTRLLNDTLLPYIKQTPPPSARGKLIKIKFIAQAEGSAPTFLFFCNYPKYVAESYSRFLESKIRQHFGFQGWPINIFFREK